MLDLHITAPDLDSFRAKILSIVGLAPIDQMTDEALLVETRQRFAKMGKVVTLRDFDAK